MEKGFYFNKTLKMKFILIIMSGKLKNWDTWPPRL